MPIRKHIAVIGGGPAGLRAAEVAAAGGAEVTVYDAKRSVGRKFLVAGKSGLNLTNGEALAQFFPRYIGKDLPHSQLQKVLSNFDNTALRQWAASLGIETFIASSGKVFPSPIDGSIKAAPLLRRWISRLREMGVKFQTSHRWTGFSADGELRFIYQNQDGEKQFSKHHDATILALGGASWPQTGSDGGWTTILEESGISVEPLTSANSGWEVRWPEQLISEAEGLPLKNITLTAGETSRRGELVLTRYGLEGGPIYRLGPAIKALPKPHVIIDFKPDSTIEQLVIKMGSVHRNFTREAKRRWKLDSATCALLKYLPNRGPWTSSRQLAEEIKNCHIPLLRPRPIEEAISSAGGVCWSELDKNFMLKKLPTIYLAGEMINWEAPTGGYLLQGCFATGTYAAQSALQSFNQ